MPSSPSGTRWPSFENALGVYLIDPDGTIRDPEIVFARIEHADPLPGLPSMSGRAAGRSSPATPCT